MPLPPYIADRVLALDATDLVRRFGPQAQDEAAMRAERSRDLGNVVSFCRWRQVERLVAVLASNEAVGTVH